MNLTVSTLHIGVLIIIVSIICWKGPVKASFTSTPGSKNYLKVGESVSLRWTYNPSFGAVIVEFSKLDPSNNVFDDLVNYVIPLNQLTVYIDQARLDMYDQATFRINHTTASDAGTYKCKVTSASSIIESTTELTIQEESSSSSIETSTSSSLSTIISSSSSSSTTSSSVKASTTPLTSYISLIGSPTSISSNGMSSEIPSTTSRYVQSTQLTSSTSSAVGLSTSSLKSMSSSKYMGMDYISTVSSVTVSSISVVTSTSAALIESSSAAKMSTIVSEAMHRDTIASPATTNGISLQSSYYESSKFSQKHSSAFTVSTSTDVTRNAKSVSSTTFYNRVTPTYIPKEQWSENTVSMNIPHSQSKYTRGTTIANFGKSTYLSIDGINSSKTTSNQKSLLSSSFSMSIDPADSVRVDASYLLTASAKRKSKNPLPSTVLVSKHIDSNNVTMNRRNSAVQAREIIALALGIPAVIFILVATIAAVVLFKKRLARNGRTSPSYEVNSPQE